MKATELMIGDLVEFHQSNGKCFYAYVEALNNYRIFSERGIFDDNEVSPIMLTSEILEKNLSTTSQIQYCWDDFLSKSFGEDFYEIRYYGDVTELVVSIRYVHELQHILKLCKIEKTIEL